MRLVVGASLALALACGGQSPEAPESGGAEASGGEASGSAVSESAVDVEALLTAYREQLCHPRRSTQPPRISPIEVEQVCTVCPPGEGAGTQHLEELTPFAGTADFVCEADDVDCDICMPALSTECDGSCCRFDSMDSHGRIGITELCVDDLAQAAPTLVRIQYEAG